MFIYLISLVNTCFLFLLSLSSVQGIGREYKIMKSKTDPTCVFYRFYNGLSFEELFDKMPSAIFYRRSTRHRRGGAFAHRKLSEESSPVHAPTVYQTSY